MIIAGAGGFLGTSLRFLVGRWLPLGAAAGHFPWATLLVNLLASFLIGVLYGLGERHHALSPETTALLTTGFCGGLSTFSSFTGESFLLLHAHHAGLFLLYISLSFSLGLALVYAGRALVR